MADTPFEELPELTLSLRSFGSRRGHGREIDVRSAEDQARFFAPLLEARRRAAEARSHTQVVSAFDGRRITALFDACIRAFANERFAARPPARRAFEAELFEIVEPLHDALRQLREVAEPLLGASAATPREAEWRAWLEQLRVTFRTADATWRPLCEALEQSPPPPPARRVGRSASSLLIALAPLAGALPLALALLAAAPRRADAQHLTVRVVGVPAESLLAHGFDVVERRRGEVLVVADDAERARLTSLGWLAAALPLRSRVAADQPRVYRSFDDPARGVRALLDSMVQVSPIVHVDSFGASFQGRPMLAVKIGSADDSPTRPNVMFMATYHAREWAATETALRLIRYLAFASTPRVDAIVRDFDVWVIPVANPDGYQNTFFGDRLWRKNMHPYGTNVGVDLNRNHSYKWGYDDVGSSPDARTETYRGPAPASEPETQAIEKFQQLHPPVTAVSYHTYAELLLYPHGYAYGLLPGDRGVFTALVGTEVRPAVLDHLPGSPQDKYRPVPAWALYPTNGEYTDWAYARLGTIAVTPELTTGYENGIYYGFEFPDDEAKLQTLFLDNLPFALDMIESSRAPLSAHPQATGIPAEPLILESASPIVRVIVPRGATPTVTSGGPVRLTLDTVEHGTFQQRWVSDTLARFPRVTVIAGALQTTFSVLSFGGAEPSDTGWTAVGFTPMPPGFAGGYAWFGSSGALRSPTVTVPTTSDTVSVTYWTHFNGNGYDPAPHGEVRMSSDGGASWALVGRVSGGAQAWYPARVVVGGVRGRTLRFEFSSPDGLPWWIDEATIIAHGAATTIAAGGELRPSANPVRTDVVHFNWPFGASAGELLAYDFAGHLAWRTEVTAGTSFVSWDIGRSGTVNGVYLVLARSAGATRRFKLFVLRPGVAAR